MNRAKKTGFVIYEKYSNFVEYEYKGEKYEVEFPTCNTYLCTSPKVQHQNKQAEIDRMLENRKNPQPVRYEDTAEYGFELFWNYVEQ